MYSSLIKISLRLQPLAYYQQCPIIHILSNDQTGENLMQQGQGCKVSVASPSILWWPQCWTHFWQFCYGQRWAFRLLTVSLHWSEFTVVSVGKNFGRIIPCSTQKTVPMIVPADGTLLNFFFLCYVMWHTIPSTTAWIWVQNGRPRSRTPWQRQEAIISCIKSVQKSSGDCFLYLFVCICQYVSQPIIRISSLFSNFHYVPLPVDRGGTSSANDTRHHWLVLLLLVFTSQSGITCQKTWIFSAPTNLSFTVTYCPMKSFIANPVTCGHIHPSFISCPLKFFQDSYSLSLSVSWVTLLILHCPLDGFPGKDVDHLWRDELRKFVTFLK